MRPEDVSLPPLESQLEKVKYLREALTFYLDFINLPSKHLYHEANTVRFYLSSYPKRESEGREFTVPIMVRMDRNIRSAEMLIEAIETRPEQLYMACADCGSREGYKEKDQLCRNCRG